MMGFWSSIFTNEHWHEYDRTLREIQVREEQEARRKQAGRDAAQEQILRLRPRRREKAVAEDTEAMRARARKVLGGDINKTNRVDLEERVDAALTAAHAAGRAEGVREERERCADIVEGFYEQYDTKSPKIAASIRGQKP
jgi:hypothetical protein